MTALLLLLFAAAVLAGSSTPSRSPGTPGRRARHAAVAARPATASGTRHTGTCRACGGRGRHPRLGIRALQPCRYKRLTAGQAGYKSIDKRGS